MDQRLDPQPFNANRDQLVPVIPDYNADPKAVPFLRWAREQIEALQRAALRREQNESNMNRGQAATMQTLGENIVNLSQRVADAFATLTVRANQISGPGTIPSTLIDPIPQSGVTGTWDKAVVTTANGSFDAGLTSVGAAGLDLSTIPGGRQIVYQHVASGRYGFAPSRLDSKVDVSDQLPFGAADVYRAIPFVWHYVNQIAIRDDPTNEYHDPAYSVPLELGLVADYLVDNNLSSFVVFNDDGKPKTVDLALFGAIANLVAVRDLDARLVAAGL